MNVLIASLHLLEDLSSQLFENFLFSLNNDGLILHPSNYPVLNINNALTDTSQLQAPETSIWLFFLFFGLACVGVYVIVKLFAHRIEIQRKVLERKVDARTAELSEQKEVLQKQSDELQKAYEEIKTKNIAIQEAFEHLSNSFSKLSDLNREKDGMMGIVAHDLRTPLNNIEGLIQLVSLDGDLNSDQKDYISKIRNVVKHGNELIRDLLDISQSKNHKPSLKLTNIKVVKFINDWKANFEKPLLSKQQKLILNGEFDDIVLTTDVGILTRIMDNLMSNALKFSEKGKSIFLELNGHEEHLSIFLRDEGPGISESDQQKMFKPFTRLSAKPTNGEPSNGLGLSIIKSLTKQLGGKIEVKSTLGEGTLFEITIPLVILEKEKV